MTVRVCLGNSPYMIIDSTPIFIHIMTYISGQLSNPEFNATKNLLPEVYHPLIEKGMMQGGHTRQLKVDVCIGDDDGIVSKQLFERLGLLCNNGDDGIVNSD